MTFRLKRDEKLVLFIGGPRHRVLEALIRKKIPIQCVFLPGNNNLKLRETILICEKNSIPLYVISKEELQGEIPLIKGRPCLSLGFSYLFPKKFIDQARFIINVHGTLLPKYRGACTLNWAIENGDTESGVTVHFVDEGCDTGDIILQKSFSIGEFDTGKSLYRKTLEFEPEVVLEALEQMYEKKVVPLPQGKTDGRDYPNRQPFHSEVNPQEPLIALYNKIRAADPILYPAYFFIAGEKVCIKLWRENKSPDQEDYI
jgi:methionyl-tRNA formyltransferase